MAGMFFAEAKRIDVFPLPRTRRGVNLLDLYFGKQYGEREHQWIQMGPYLKERGHQVLTVTTAGSPLQARLQNAHLSVNGMVTTGWMNALRTIWRLAGIIRNSHTDIVRVHRPADLLPAVLAKRLAGFGKVLWQLQPGDEHFLTRYCRSRWLRQVDAMLVPTRQLQSQIPERGLRRTIPLFRIRPGVDLRKFYPNTILRDTWREYYGIQPHEVVIATAVFSKEWRQQTLFLEAAARVNRKLPGLRFVLWVDPQTSDPQRMQRLHAHILQQRLQDIVVLCRQERERFEQTNVCDVFVQLETQAVFPLRLLEAMACGAVPIGSNSGCVPEIIEHNRNGLLVPPENASALAEAMFKLAGDAGKRKRLAQKARQTVEARFNLMKYLEQLENIFDEILKT